MHTKPILKILGTLLLLLGIFGYLFPHWHGTFFTNNENLWHLVTALLILLAANTSSVYRRYTLGLAMILYLALGIYGFTLQQPTDFHFKNASAQLDLIDNIIHLGTGLIFGWFWIRSRSSQS